MDTLNQVKTKLAEYDKHGLERVCLAAKVPFHTALKIVNGATKNPRWQTVKRLAVQLKLD